MNPSTLSRADLVRELLAPPFRDFIQTTPHVGDYETAFEEVTTNDSALNRKLDAARELLLRDLHAQMCMGSVMNSPQALRDWLRLHCANLEHEVFLVLYLTAQHQLIEAVELFRGTLTQLSVTLLRKYFGWLRHFTATQSESRCRDSGYWRRAGYG